MKIQVPAILTSLALTKDGGMRAGFATQELNDEDKLILTKLHGQFGYLLFQPNQFTLEDLPTEQAEDKNKTPSKRQRAVLFLIWKKLGAKGDFDTYYRERLEKNIERLKTELEDTI